MNIRAIGGILFTSIVLLVIVAALVATTSWPYDARLLPSVIGIPAALLCLILIAQDVLRARRPDASEENVRILDIQTEWDMPMATVAHRAVVIFGWVFGLFAAIWLVGFLPSVPIFVFLYLALQGAERWWTAALYSVVTFILMVGLFHYVLHVVWLRGVFPWPQRTLLEWLNALF